MVTRRTETEDLRLPEPGNSPFRVVYSPISRSSLVFIAMLLIAGAGEFAAALYEPCHGSARVELQAPKSGQ
jgi:hypothetical protein